jgi:hypothetical protein
LSINLFFCEQIAPGIVIQYIADPAITGIQT